MAMKLSKMYGMDIYTDGATYVGKVNDIILNLEKGEVVRLTTEPLQANSTDEAKQVLQNKSVLYKNVYSVKDVLLVTKKGARVEEIPIEIPEPQTRPRGLMGKR